MGVLGPVVLSAAVSSPGAAFGATVPSPQTEAGWQQAITHLAAPALGCYHASYPVLQWRAVTCRAAPRWPLEPAVPSQPAAPAATSPVGDGNDYSAEVAGTISQATGSFPYISKGIAEEGQVGGEGSLVANTFTLQLDTQFFTDPPACSGSSDPGACQGWQQFVYETDSGTVYMQYWLIKYAATCPSGWITYSDDCYTNSPASTYPGGAITAADLATTTVSGSASLGGDDEVTLVSGGQATMAANVDSVLSLAQYWDITEFGVFGDGNGSRAYFGTHTILATATTLASTSSSAPTCVQEGFTSETNNIELGHTPAIDAQVSPTMASVQGNGSSQPASCSVAPGVGALTGVTSLAGGYCGLLASGGVDCWGNGPYGQLGDGQVGASAVPVVVEGVGGTGSLTGVTSLASDGDSYCALLASSGVDCWGDGQIGQLGDGMFYTGPPYGSAVPVPVEGVSGAGTLSGVASLDSGDEGYCAVLASGGVDCWGGGASGQLGDGTFYTSGNKGSAVPVRVEGVGGTGTLTGAASVTGDSDSYCAVLASGGVDCWGDGQIGQLGDGQFHTGPLRFRRPGQGRRGRRHWHPHRGRRPRQLRRRPVRRPGLRRGGLLGGRVFRPARRRDVLHHR